MAAEVTVRVEYVGHELGHWCNTCMLSTGVRLWWTTTTEPETTLRSTVFCTECDGANVSLSDDAVDVTGQLGEDDDDLYDEDD